MPIRIQRKRVKGWKMPPNTISVTRPGEYGNPFVVGGWYKVGNGMKAGEFSWLRCHDSVLAVKQGFFEIDSIEQAIKWYEILLTRYPLRQSDIDKLKGKNLACFCKEGSPCHADILLKLANPQNIKQ